MGGTGHFVNRPPSATSQTTTRPVRERGLCSPLALLAMYSRRFRWRRCNLLQLFELIRNLQQARVDLPQCRLS